MNFLIKLRKPLAFGKGHSWGVTLFTKYISDYGIKSHQREFY